MIEDKIKYINKSVAESLQFAEAKNAALITFNGAALYAVIEGKDLMPKIIHDYVPFWSMLLVAGISISLIAFLPIMNPSTFPSSREIAQRQRLGDSVSIFYFGHLRLFDTQRLIRMIYSHYGEEIPKKFKQFELDLTMQTIALSRITWRKYLFFSMAGHLTLITLIIPIPFLIIYWLHILTKQYRKKKVWEEENVGTGQGSGEDH